MFRNNYGIVYNLQDVYIFIFFKVKNNLLTYTPISADSDDFVDITVDNANDVLSCKYVLTIGFQSFPKITLHLSSQSSSATLSSSLSSSSL